MKTKKMLYELQPLNLIATVVFSIMTYFAITGNPNPLYYGLITSLILVLFSSALSGVILGGLPTIGVLIFGIYLKIYKILAPLYEPSKKRIEKIGLEKAQAESLLKQTAYKNYINFLSKYFVLIVILAIILMVVARVLYLKLREKNSSKKRTNKVSTRLLSYMSMFVALSVVLNTLRVGTISFGGFPIIYSGLALGPIAGFIVGGISDLLGFLIRPSGNAYNILFTLTSAMTGAIPIIIVRLIEKSKLIKNGKDGRKNFVAVLVGIIIGQGVTTLGLVPLFVQILYGTPWIASFTRSAMQQVWSIPMYSFLFVTTWSIVNRQIEFEKINTNLNLNDTN